LPSSRQLASDLGLARNTVAEAYNQLVAEGWLVARQGSGTRVAPRLFEPAHDVAVTSARPTSSPYDLRAGSPDLSSFPADRWLAALRRALNTAPVSDLGYGDPRGRRETRQVLAGYLARSRGVRADPGNIVLCSGFAHGLALLCSLLRARRAATVAVESYSLPAYREVLASHGLAVSSVPVDEHGAVITRLADAGAALLTPAHQFPLGPSLAPARRTAAVSWAADGGGLLLEDDYDGEFRYDRHPLAAMQALGPDHVVYLGTASKTLAPGLRLGWLVLPSALVEPVLAAAAGVPQASVLEQLTLAEFISSGAYDRHVRRRRLVYRRRRDLLVRAVTGAVPGAAVTGIAAGLHALVALPKGVREDEATAAAARHGVTVTGLSGYRAGGQDHRPALVVGYGTPADHAFTAAVARLTAALDSLA
jgi:GntR family transcriptional regulator/MocR family aminotransferase